MQTLANRSCDKCGASRYGGVEDYNEWLSVHTLEQHTSAKDKFASHMAEEVAFIDEEIEFLSGHPTPTSIKDRIERLKLKLKLINKLQEGQGESINLQDRGGPTGSTSGFALS